MSSLKSPLGDPAEVKKIVDEITALSVEAVAFDDAISRFNKSATDLAKEHDANFAIGEKLPNAVAEFRNIWRLELKSSRDAATVTAFQLQKLVQSADVIETVEKKEDVKPVVDYLVKAFVQKESPLQLKPLEGFEGVNKSFINVWILVAKVAKEAADILEKAPDSAIKKVVACLLKDLKPISEGSTNSQKALDYYATHIA